MKERRSLIEGVKPAGEVDPALEREFVFGSKAKAERPKPPHDPNTVGEIREGKGQAAPPPPAFPLPLQKIHVTAGRYHPGVMVGLRIQLGNLPGRGGGESLDRAAVAKRHKVVLVKTDPIIRKMIAFSQLLNIVAETL